MDRLTEQGHIYRDYEFMEDGMAPYISRLAAYEDTGLTPDEVKDHEEMFKAYRHVCGGKSPEEIQQMITEQANAPLTPDELRQMDGEPVYFVENERKWDISEWVLCIKAEGNWIRFVRPDGNPMYRDSSRYGKTWLAYRRKPKEEAL